MTILTILKQNMRGTINVNKYNSDKLVMPYPTNKTSDVFILFSPFSA